MTTYDDDPFPNLTPEDLERQQAADAEPNDPDESNKSVAARLVELAAELVSVVADPSGAAHAVRHNGPRIALRLKGRDGLRPMLSREWFNRTGKVASSNALGDAIAVLEGEAQTAERVEIPVRIGERDGVIYIDMGTPSGEAIALSPSGWTITADPPVLFRRTELTGPMLTPDRSGSVDSLRPLLNVDEENFRLIVGWLVHALIPNMPHAILAMTGQQGTGKTVGAQTLIRVIDPSPALTRSAPRDLGQWSTTASAGWISGIDNISTIPGWLSDAWCRTVTGEGFIGRALYTDADLSVTSFRRCIVLTSIDAGAMAGDLAERILPIELQPIPKTERKTDKAMQELLARALPSVLGGVLNLTVDVLKALPSVHKDELPRMADFARVLAALDKVTGWTTFDDYAGTAVDVAETVIESDVFATAVRNLVSARDWEGTAGELLAAITPEKPPKGWPKSAQGATGALKRAIPALSLIGVDVTKRERSSARRGYIIERRDRGSEYTSRERASTSSFSSSTVADQGLCSDDASDEPLQTDSEIVTTEKIVTENVTHLQASDQGKHTGSDNNDDVDTSYAAQTHDPPEDESDVPESSPPRWGVDPSTVELDLGIPAPATLAPKEIGHREMILAHLIDHGPADRKTLAEATGKDPGATSSTLTRAARRNFVEQNDEGSFSITDAGAEYLAEVTGRIAS